MFPALFSLVTGYITITDDLATSSPSISSTRDLSECPQEKHNASLLSLLDDKNNIIRILKEQLQNQKMQLMYYMNREMNGSKIRKLSETCTPQASEESLPLNLAINKFCKQTGIKTKLLLLHEHMNRLEYKISRSLKDQEFLLRRIVNKFCEFARVQDITSPDFRENFGKFITDPLSINLFDKLLTATLSLRRRLEHFRICCDRVLIIEEERNSIAEQVYSLPVEERINCNYLVGIQMEKSQLENEIRRITECRTSSRHSIKELNAIETILHNLQRELNSSFSQNEERRISRMLEKINFEAEILLDVTKEQKRKFECESSKAKGSETNRVLLFIDMASAGDKFENKEDLDSCGLKTDEEICLFKLIKEKMDLHREKCKEEGENEITMVKNECDLLKAKVARGELESIKLKLMNKSLREEVDDFKNNELNRVRMLMQERDAYKTQVEDLQVIREAYAQLVDKQPNTCQVEMKRLQEIRQRDSRIHALEKQLTIKKEEVEALKSKIARQNDQISVLNRFINLTRPNTPKFEEKLEYKNTRNRKRTPESKSNDYSKSSDGCHYRTKTKQDDSKSKKSDPQFPLYQHCWKKYKTISRDCQVHYEKKNPVDYSRYSEELQKLMSESFEALLRSDDESGSCIFSGDRVQTVVTTSEEIKGKVKMEKSSMFSVEIKYKNGDLYELDEFELFKDVSIEAMPPENKFSSSPRYK